MEPEKSIALRPKFEVESNNSVDKILEKANQLKTELKADYQIKIQMFVNDFDLVMRL